MFIFLLIVCLMDSGDVFQLYWRLLVTLMT